MLYLVGAFLAACPGVTMAPFEGQTVSPQLEQ